MGGNAATTPAHNRNSANDGDTTLLGMLMHANKLQWMLGSWKGRAPRGACGRSSWCRLTLGSQIGCCRRLDVQTTQTPTPQQQRPNPATATPEGKSREQVAGGRPPAAGTLARASRRPPTCRGHQTALQAHKRQASSTHRLSPGRARAHTHTPRAHAAAPEARRGSLPSPRLAPTALIHQPPTSDQHLFQRHPGRRVSWQCCSKRAARNTCHTALANCSRDQPCNERTSSGAGAGQQPSPAAPRAASVTTMPQSQVATPAEMPSTRVI